MYLGIDIGGTKTLVATLDDQGVIIEWIKFPTPANYEDFLPELTKTIGQLEAKVFKAAGVAAPGRIDRVAGRIIRLGNLGWTDVPLQSDVAAIIHCPVVIENDANLAGLSEAQLQPEYETVLYLTVSTGIGSGVVYQGSLAPVLLDSESGHLLLLHDGELKRWEDFASGRAIYNHFNKKAADIPAEDTASWDYVADNLMVGFYENIAIIQPDLIIIGGSIGTYFDRYAHLLKAKLERYRRPVVDIPAIMQAQRPEEAVIYGCYDLAKQSFPDAAATV